jgi:lipopolysaccharide transport system ATP-binding protein
MLKKLKSALDDLSTGCLLWRIWASMAQLDVRRRYRRSLLGQFWITVSTILRSEVLILHEMLGAGDQKFVAKSEERLKSYMENLEILILAIHNTNILRQHCNEAIVMRSGKIVFDGRLGEGIHFHESSM